MAILNAHTVILIYQNERMEFDDALKSDFPHLPSQKTETLKVENAYIAIDEISGTKETLNCRVNFYKDHNKKCLIDSKRYTFSPDVTSEHTPNFYTQAYEYLKTLPEYAGAIDV